VTSFDSQPVFRSGCRSAALAAVGVAIFDARVAGGQPGPVVIPDLHRGETLTRFIYPIWPGMRHPLRDRSWLIKGPGVFGSASCLPYLEAFRHFGASPLTIHRNHGVVRFLSQNPYFRRPSARILVYLAISPPTGPYAAVYALFAFGL